MTKEELKSILNLPSPEAAPRLIGVRVSHNSSIGLISGVITEVEAYEQDDPASHTFGGKTDRNQAMFGPAGHAYIYLSYGMHWCLNVTTDREGYGSGVLIRGIHVVEGADLAAKFRFGADSVKDLKPVQYRSLSNGPGKVTQALGVNKDLYGTNLFGEDSPLQLEFGVEVPSKFIITTPRIGISRAVDLPWRWLINSEYFKYHSIH